MKRKKMLLGALAVALLISTVSAAVLTWYGQIVTVVDIKQSVWLDDKEGQPVISDTIPEPSPGGERFCFKHNLTNQASVPAAVKFETTYDPELTDEEIKTRIYEPSEHVITVTQGHKGYGGDLFDFTEVKTADTTDYFGWDPLTITKIFDLDRNLIITIEAPNGINQSPENFGMPFDTDCDGTMDWQIQYHSDPESEDRTFPWGFSELIDGTYTKDMKVNNKRQWSRLPDWIQASGSDKVFTIKIDSDKLGNNNGKTDDCGLCYRFGLFMVENDEGYPESWKGEAAIITFPEPGFDWYDSSGLEEETLGTLIEDTLTIPTKETVIFCICYEFAINIAPETYTIKTWIKPA